MGWELVGVGGLISAGAIGRLDVESVAVAYVDVDVDDRQPIAGTDLVRDAQETGL